jgi:hypothetical protein
MLAIFEKVASQRDRDGPGPLFRPGDRSIQGVLLLQLEQVIVLYLAVGIQAGDEPIRYSRLGGGNAGAQVDRLALRPPR